ncbi:Uracil phosphoribosyltransferase [Roseimaritima ulvae]|uniref:uracil phosphoribosyltransferase n=2 Tax=Roseimaritima ulvae TaxID=980254 RepID=A0A5B9QQB5_9BACT|nr:Uracil phosphoribosyltransferase [Roseimaritima ulvae]
MVLGVAATEDLPTRQVRVETPITTTDGQQLDTRIAIVPILRAGLGLVEPVLTLLPDAQVWHLGLYRNEQTAEPVPYYDKLPTCGAPHVGLVLDPMLATGGSVELVIQRIQQWGVSDIRVLSVIASQPGIDRILRDYPHVRIFTCAVDPELNEQSFIVPGLGDAGDRIFDTPQG